MKKIKITLTVLLTLFFLSSCNSVKKGLAGSKEKGSDEFLVKKKTPLVMPPDYKILPQPTNAGNAKSEEIDLKKIIDQEMNIKKNTKKPQKLNISLEEFILEKIK
tara:strand:- start:68 stop:382 length:315 start_codon:yes stop_codon:yes gene_type:complete